MANTFTFTISAVDKATATVRKVNDSIGRMTRPFEDVGKSFKSLGRELGFEKIGKNLTAIGREAEGAARGVGAIVAPLAAITGIGSVAGVVSLAKSWGELGRSIDNSSHAIGISSNQLQSFQGAAKLVGIDTATTTASLDGLATTMQDAKWGRNQGALQLLNKLGIGLKQTKDGAWDVVGEYKAIANAIANEKSPQVQALIANNLGLGAMLPFLREGEAGIARYEETVKRLGYVMDESAVKRGKDFAQSLSGLDIAIDGTKNAIGDSLIPIIKPMVDDFANWLAVNRQLIATDIASWAKGFATWVNSIDWKSVGTGLVDFGKGISDVVEWLGGWKKAALIVAGVMSASLIGSVVALGGNLLTAGLGVVAFVKLLGGWRTAALETAAAQNTLSAAGAGRLLMGGAVIGTSLLLSGDKSESSMAASDLQNAAMGGDRTAALTLAERQLTHWFLPKPSAEDISKRADEISSGRQQGLSPEQMKASHPDRAASDQMFKNLEIKNGLPPNLLDSVWDKESSRGQKMTSTAGAEGHFQFMPATAAQYGLRNPANLEESADAAARMYRDLLKANGGDLDKALAAYNWGQGNLDKKGLAAAPAETRDYIRKVEAAMASKSSPDPVQIANPTALSKPDPVAQSAPVAPAPAPVAPAPAPQGPITSNTAEPVNGKLHLEIAHVNAPEGTKSRLKDEGNILASSRISYSGVGGNIA